MSLNTEFSISKSLRGLTTCCPTPYADYSPSPLGLLIWSLALFFRSASSECPQCSCWQPALRCYVCRWTLRASPNQGLSRFVVRPSNGRGRWNPTHSVAQWASLRAPSDSRGARADDYLLAEWRGRSMGHRAPRGLIHSPGATSFKVFRSS